MGQGLNEQDWNLKFILSSDSQFLLRIRITLGPFRNSKVQASPSITSIGFSVSVTQTVYFKSSKWFYVLPRLKTTNFSQLRQEAAAQRGEAACLKSHHHLQTEVCGWSSLLPLSEPPHVLGILVSENLNHTAHSKACVELYLQRHEKEFWLRHFENWPETFLVYKNPLWRESLLPESEEWCYTGRAGGWEMESEQKGEERGKLYLLSTCFSEQGPNAKHFTQMSLFNLQTQAV